MQDVWIIWFLLRNPWMPKILQNYQSQDVSRYLFVSTNRVFAFCKKCIPTLHVPKAWHQNSDFCPVPLNRREENQHTSNHIKSILGQLHFRKKYCDPANVQWRLVITFSHGGLLETQVTKNSPLDGSPMIWGSFQDSTAPYPKPPNPPRKWSETEISKIGVCVCVSCFFQWIHWRSSFYMFIPFIVPFIIYTFVRWRHPHEMNIQRFLFHPGRTKQTTALLCWKVFAQLRKWNKGHAPRRRVIFVKQW